MASPRLPENVAGMNWRYSAATGSERSEHGQRATSQVAVPDSQSDVARPLVIEAAGNNVAPLFLCHAPDGTLSKVSLRCPVDTLILQGSCVDAFTMPKRLQESVDEVGHQGAFPQNPISNFGRRESTAILFSSTLRWCSRIVASEEAFGRTSNAVWHAIGDGNVYVRVGFAR